MDKVEKLWREGDDLLAKGKKIRAEGLELLKESELLIAEGCLRYAEANALSKTEYAVEA